MRLQTCESCGAPFARTRPRVRRCAACEPPGRAGASPTTRAQNAEYQRNRRLLLKPSPLCHWCQLAPATTADHLVAVAHGGSNRMDNLVPACSPCNNRRQDNPDWRPDARSTDPTPGLPARPAPPSARASARDHAPARAQGQGPLTIT